LSTERSAQLICPRNQILGSPVIESLQAVCEERHLSRYYT
jgi:hypothetical protein